MPFIRTKKGKGKVKYKKPLLSVENFSENLCKPVAISYILCKTLAIETDEAEITAARAVQRACDDESQVRTQLSNGPRRAQ